MTSAAVAIVPVDADDPSAPLGCAALRQLRSSPLLAWAVRTLTSSGVVPVTLVAVPPALEEAVARVLRPGSRGSVRILPVDPGGPGHTVSAALDSPLGRGAAPGAEDIVVVHDALHPLSSPALVRSVVDALAATPGCAGTAPARPVTDTLKWVDEDDVLVRTVDREGYRVVYSPQAYRRSALADALAAAPAADLGAPGAEILPRLVGARGAPVRLLPVPGEAFPVATDDDLVLAEALLQRSADQQVRQAAAGAGPAGVRPGRGPAGTSP